MNGWLNSEKETFSTQPRLCFDLAAKSKTMICICKPLFFHHISPSLFNNMPDVNQGFGCIVIPESRPNCLAMHTAYHVARGYNVGPDFLPFFIASPRIAFEAKFLSFALLPKRPHASLLVTCHEDRRKTISTICKSSFVSTYSNKVRACVPRSEKPGKINRTARK